MTEATHPIEDSAAGTVSVLNDALGLTPEGFRDFKKVLAEVLSVMGLDGPAVIERLANGTPLADAMALPSGITDVLYARAHNWVNVGRYDKAESLFRALCVLDGRNRDYWLGYGICLKLRGQLKPAEMALEVAAEVDPASPLGQYHLLDLAMRRGEWQRASAQLAAYDERASLEVPAAITTEVEKYRAILAHKLAAVAEPSPS